jgi:flagellar basal body L-ring protein FlgH
MKIRSIAIIILCACLTAAKKPNKPAEASPLDQTLAQIAAAEGTERQAAQPGSVWTPTALFSDLSADLRARRVGDIVTILVQERASAVSSGTVKTQRNSSLQSNIAAAGKSRQSWHQLGSGWSRRNHSRYHFDGDHLRRGDAGASQRKSSDPGHQERQD